MDIFKKKSRGISYGKRHKIKITGGIGKDVKTSKIKPTKIRKEKVISEPLKKKEKSSKKRKKYGKRLWRKII